MDGSIHEGRYSYGVKTGWLLENGRYAWTVGGQSRFPERDLGGRRTGVVMSYLLVGDGPPRDMKSCVGENIECVKVEPDRSGLAE